MQLQNKKSYFQPVDAIIPSPQPHWNEKKTTNKQTKEKRTHSSKHTLTNRPTKKQTQNEQTNKKIHPTINCDVRTYDSGL